MNLAAIPIRLMGLLALAMPFSPADAAERLEPVTQAWLTTNYTKAEYQIPMRDGVTLFTLVYAPQDTSVTYPIWLVRTPYNAGPHGTNNFPEPGGPLKYYAREKFIFVVQDVRGRYGSGGHDVDTRLAHWRKGRRLLVVLAMVAQIDHQKKSGDAQ